MSIRLCACLSLVLALPQSMPAAQEPAYYVVPFAELELGAGQVLPNYAGEPPWEGWDAGVEDLPWAALEGEGEWLLDTRDYGQALATDGPRGSAGSLCVRTARARELRGTLYLPKASGTGFLRLEFRVPAARATAAPGDYQRAEQRHCRRMLRLGVPGGAWYRHRNDALQAELGAETEPEAAPAWWNQRALRAPEDTLGLFSGGRALYENLQLERGLPTSPEGEETVALDTLEGIQVRAIDWKPLLTEGATALDPLAARVPADQHGLFFASFPAFVATLEEAGRLGEFGLSAFEARSSDAGTRARSERQLGLELSALARTFGPLVVESVALTGSDAYLRTGSDLALLFQARSAEVVHAFIAARQDEAAAAAGVQVLSGEVAGLRYRGVADATRSLSSYLATLGEAVVVSNSLTQLERLARVAAGDEPALASLDEYRFFRQRYALGADQESALLVLSDAAIRRWCSPRWRIANARVTRAAAALAEEHVLHFSALAAGRAGSQELGPDPDFPALGTLRLTPQGVHSSVHGTLDFLTPIAELDLARVSAREAQLYQTWRAGYERAWSNFFDPIGARLSITPQRTLLDLTVRPLILDSEYDDLRRITRGPGLPPGAGDPHAEALVHFVMGLDPGWEELKSVGSVLGAAGSKLGADPFSWLGGWLAVYADEGAFWDELLQTEDLDEALQGVQDELNQIPLAVAVAVANPLKLALFLSAARAFVDGTAPGLSEWKERVVGERRFVEISSPGLGQAFSLYYATTPTALVLSLHEPTLLRAMEREERRRARQDAPPAHRDGAHAALELRGRGLEVLEHLFGGEVGAELRRGSFANLPILNEWKRRFPAEDPLALHARVFREGLVCPGGGSYAWNEAWQTMESSVYGHPGEPRPGVRWPPGWSAFTALRFALTFEQDGLRVRAEIERE